ncbi:hypothetical protein ACQ4LE_008602 [Meloidogyne hapla]|uniref:protein-serine/threonine phosphatase n=1 Tax=Meloidogyne hapla TaxID=6305 RepID=A0A1I8B467_MELHA
MTTPQIRRQTTTTTTAQMPKLLHALCCCLRPNPLNEKNDSRSCVNTNNNVYDSSRGISKTGSPMVNKTSAQLEGNLRQRLNPKSGKTSKTKHGFSFIIGKGHQQQQQKRMATQITVDGNSNIIASSNNCSNNNNNASNIAIDGPFLGSDKQQNELKHSTSNWSSSQDQQQQQKQNNCSPLTSRVQWPLAPLLSSPIHRDRNKKCLILDLDETLVHSSFKPVKNADFVIPIEIDNVVHQVYVLKRPHTDHFLERVGALFECVLFTASLAKYADPVADLLDRRQVFRFRLFREACVFFEGNYVKDLEKLGRDLRKVIIIDNSPASYAFHPNNSLPIRTWFDDPDDTELLDLLPILEELARVEDIYSLIGNFPSPMSSLQQQQRYQQQQRLQQQYSSPYYPTSTSTTSISTSGPSSIITQAAMPSDANNNNKAFSALSIRNNEEDSKQQKQSSNTSSSLIYIQMERRGDEENNNKKKEENQKQQIENQIRRRIGNVNDSTIYEQQQQGFNTNNRNISNASNNSTSTSSNSFGFNTTSNRNASSNNVVDYYSRPSTSFGGKKWK